MLSLVSKCENAIVAIPNILPDHHATVVHTSSANPPV